MDRRTKADKQRQQEVFNKKVEEYSKLTLEELKELFNSKKWGGSYKEAILYVTNQKLEAEKQKAVLDAIEKSKETTKELNDSVESLTTKIEETKE